MFLSGISGKMLPSVINKISYAMLLLSHCVLYDRLQQLNFYMTSQYFSREGLEKMKAELEYRMNTLRPEIARRIKEAKDQGDLSENAEFDAAKEEQSMNEGRIEELRVLVENAVIITAGSNGSGVVTIGSKIKVNSKNGEKEFNIVGASESDPMQGLISNESPLGRSFLGHKKGDKIEVKTPSGVVAYEILEVK